MAKNATRKSSNSGVRIGRVIRGLLKIRKTRKVMPLAALTQTVKQLAA